MKQMESCPGVSKTPGLVPNALEIDTSTAPNPGLQGAIKSAAQYQP
jgi:hypothetical protein